MASWLNVCRFIPTAGGTTDWTFAAAVTGFQSPTAAGVVNGTLYKYRAESGDLSQWEIGEGAYNTGTGVLARTTVLANNLGTTVKVSFNSIPQIAIVALKEDLANLTTANTFTNAITASNYIATVAPTTASLDCASSTVTIVNGGNATIAFASGIVIVTDQSSTGATAAYLTGSATPLFLGVSGGGATFVAPTTTPAAGKASVNFDGVSAMKIYNNIGSTITFGVAVIKTRTGI